MKKQLRILLATLLFTVVTLAHADLILPDITYEKSQTWSGHPFIKDEHVWIYNSSFAKLFRMPTAWIDEDLKGIEAAAFRIGEAALKCGLGGKKDTCARFHQCQLDIYVDEKKHPLPWVTNKTAEWLPGSDSFAFLRDEERGVPGRFQPPKGIKWDFRYPQHALHPFGDWGKKRPAYYMQNAQTPDDYAVNPEVILAYQRQIYGDLTMIRLNYGCLSRNKRPFTSFWLVLAPDNWKGGMRDKSRHVYHHFQLPVSFEREIDAIYAAHKDIEMSKYKQILNK